MCVCVCVWGQVRLRARGRGEGRRLRERRGFREEIDDFDTGGFFIYNKGLLADVYFTKR